MRMLLVLAVLVGGQAVAEVKPASNVTPQLCGWLNRSLRLCAAEAKATKNSYIMLSHFLGENKVIGPVTKKEVQGTTTLTGYGVDKDDSGNYLVEKKYVLVVASGNAREFVGTLKSEFRNRENKLVVETFRTVPLEVEVQTRSLRSIDEELPAISKIEVLEN